MASIEKRTGKNGKVTYRVKVRLNGQPPVSATFDKKSDAKKWAQDVESDIRHNRHFKYAESKKHLLSELIDRYIEAILPLKRSNRTQLGMLNWWNQEIGSYTVSNITPAMIAERRDKLLQGETPKGQVRAPATVVRYLAILSHVFSIAIKEWYWAESNPVLSVSKPKEPPGRTRFLDEDELKRLLYECNNSSNEYLPIIVHIALATGMRLGELLGLEWSDINLKEGFITVQRTKNNETKRLYLPTPVLSKLSAFAKVRSLKTSLLFPSNTNPNRPIDIRQPWEATLQRAAITNFRFHDLRHTAASYLAMSGATLLEIKEILGHKTLQMVQRYAHLSDSHTKDIVTKTSVKLFK